MSSKANATETGAGEQKHRPTFTLPLRVNVYGRGTLVEILDAKDSPILGRSLTTGSPDLQPQLGLKRVEQVEDIVTAVNGYPDALARAEAAEAALQKMADLGEAAIQPDAINWTNSDFDARIGEMRHIAYKALAAAENEADG